MTEHSFIYETYIAFDSTSLKIDNKLDIINSYLIGKRKSKFILDINIKTKLINKSLKIIKNLALSNNRFLILSDQKYLIRKASFYGILEKKEWVPGFILRYYNKKVNLRKKYEHIRKTKLFLALARRVPTILINMLRGQSEIQVKESKVLSLVTISFISLLNPAFIASDFSIPFNHKFLKESYFLHELVIFELIQTLKSISTKYVLSRLLHIINNLHSLTGSKKISKRIYIYNLSKKLNKILKKKYKNKDRIFIARKFKNHFKNIDKIKKNAYFTKIYNAMLNKSNSVILQKRKLRKFRRLKTYNPRFVMFKVPKIVRYKAVKYKKFIKMISIRSGLFMKLKKFFIFYKKAKKWAHIDRLKAENIKIVKNLKFIHRIK